MIRTMAIVVGAAIALLWPGAAHAQLTVPTERAPIAFGPLSLYPTIALVDIGTDSNIFNNAIEAKEDYTFTFQSRVTTVLSGGANRLTFLTGSDLVWFQKYKDQRSSNAQYAVRADLTWSRFKPFLSADRLKTRERANIEIDARARRTDRSVEAGIDYVVSSITSITASARVDDSHYDYGEKFRGVELADALDHSGRSVRAGMKFVVTPFTTLVMTADIDQDRFTGNHLRDSNSFRIAPALELSREAAISGRVAAGYRKFKPVDPTQRDFGGLTMEATLLYNLLGVTTFDLLVNRDVSYSYLDSEAFVLSTGARLGITQRVAGPFDLRASARRERLSYRWHDELTPEAGFDPRRDIADVLSGGVQVRIGGTRVGVSVERTLRRSTLSAAERNFDKTRLIGSVNVGSGN